jgi:hypothetical protein
MQLPLSVVGQGFVLAVRISGDEGHFGGIAQQICL